VWEKGGRRAGEGREKPAETAVNGVAAVEI